MRLHWPTHLPALLAALDQAHGDKRAAADALSIQLGQRVTADALTGALSRYAREIAEMRAGQGARPAVSDAVLRARAPRPPGELVEALQDRPMLKAGEARPSVAARCVSGVAPVAPPLASNLVAILADLHIPQHDPAAVACAESWIAANRPATIVLAGDVGEWESCSQHGTSPEAPNFRADVEAVREWLRHLRRIAPDARIIFLEGNHETRLSRMLCSQAPAVYGALTVPVALGLDALGIEWVPEDRQPIKLGTLYIVHGHQMLRGNGPVYIAAKAVNVYGSPGHTVVVAHTHKRQMFRRPMADGFAEGLAIDCLRSLGAGWLHGEVAGWSHGFAVATLREGHRTALEAVSIDGGSCVWGGRVYGAA